MKEEKKKIEIFAALSAALLLLLGVYGAGALAHLEQGETANISYAMLTKAKNFGIEEMVEHMKEHMGEEYGLEEEEIREHIKTCHGYLENSEQR